LVFGLVIGVDLGWFFGLVCLIWVGIGGWIIFLIFWGWFLVFGLVFLFDWIV